MRPYYCAFLVVVFALLTASISFAQSLGELAKKEKERRQQIQSEVKVITNYDSSKYRAGAVTTGGISPTPAAQGIEKEPATKSEGGYLKATPDEPTDFQGRPEGWWRQTMADARKKVKDLESEQNIITLRLADLQNQFYRESSGFKQQDIQREIQKTFFVQDQNKENLGKAKKELEDLEKEARKSGALPGWLTSREP